MGTTAYHVALTPETSELLIVNLDVVVGVVVDGSEAMASSCQACGDPTSEPSVKRSSRHRHRPRTF